MNLTSVNHHLKLMCCYMLCRQTTAEGLIFYQCAIFFYRISNLPSRRADLAKSVPQKNSSPHSSKECGVLVLCGTPTPTLGFIV